MSDIEDLADDYGTDIELVVDPNVSQRRVMNGRRQARKRFERWVDNSKTYARVTPCRNVTLPRLKFLDNGSDE